MYIKVLFLVLFIANVVGAFQAKDMVAKGFAIAVSALMFETYINLDW